MAACAAAVGTEQCAICLDDIISPRLLPCIHAFCLECLEGYCRSLDRLAGDDVPCPQCRTEFNIPKNGVADFPVKQYAEKRFSRRTELAQQLDISSTSGECLLNI